MNRALSILAVCAAIFVAGLVGHLDRAHAQSRPGDEVITTCSQSIASEAPIVSAVSGKRLQIRGAVLRSSGAGVVVFTDGASGTTIANLYLEADTPFVIDDRVLGTGGITTTAGNALYATLSGATLTGVFRVARD
jgi:hypothetical protein